MRRFLIIGHKAVTSGDFKLDDMAGGAGRLDILLRCINSAFFLSHGIRRDTEIYLVMQGGPDPTKVIRIVGAEVRYLNPDERSTGALVRNALMKAIEGETRSSPGIYISRKSFAELLDELGTKGELIYLKEDGEDVRQKRFTEDVTFVISDNTDLTEEEEGTLLKHHPAVLKLGPLSYHADHCIIIMHNELDNGTSACDRTASTSIGE
jgi:tRNA (pseudouridine54-N1)-methyltransferase